MAPYAARLGFPDPRPWQGSWPYSSMTLTVSLLPGPLPGSVADMPAKTGLSEQRVSQVTHRLLHKGAISRVISKGQYYRLFPAMIELRDAVVITPGLPPGAL
ncbi:MAG: hypothetical protein MZU91_01735 [Desulfosudis oleivorans]|nr:hypothetical protein [Desulfosudis oleivorans]